MKRKRKLAVSASGGYGRKGIGTDFYGEGVDPHFQDAWQYFSFQLEDNTP
jgi:hypothetical protein